MSSNPSRLGYTRQRLKSKMPNICIVRNLYNGVITYNGICRVQVAQAAQGQLSEPDPVEGDVSAYASWRLFFPYPESAGKIKEGQAVTTIDPLTELSIEVIVVAVEDVSSDQVNTEARAVKQRTGVPEETLVLYRMDDDGVETQVTAQQVQIVLDSPTPLGASPEGSGGSVAYLPGTIIFYESDADVKRGDYFKYQGRHGDVTGVPIRAFDRTEARMRVSASHL